MGLDSGWNSLASVARYVVRFVCLCDYYFGHFKKWECTKLNVTYFSWWACEIAAEISYVTILATPALTP